jgi:hypothetical protein
LTTARGQESALAAIDTRTAGRLSQNNDAIKSEKHYRRRNPLAAFDEPSEKTFHQP